MSERGSLVSKCILAFMATYGAASLIGDIVDCEGKGKDAPKGEAKEIKVENTQSQKKTATLVVPAKGINSNR